MTTTITTQGDTTARPGLMERLLRFFGRCWWTPEYQWAITETRDSLWFDQQRAHLLARSTAH